MATIGSLGVDAFKARLAGGGARANLFMVTMTFPAYAGGNPELCSFLIKGASLPASTIANVDVGFRGRKLKVAGDRTFEPWTITVINDTTMDIRNSFERWMDGMNSHVINVGYQNPLAYQSDLRIQQLDKTASVTKTYDLRGAFPTSVSAIEMNYDTNDAVEEFTVELQYQYWVSHTTT
jgi:hypothetical protein